MSRLISTYHAYNYNCCVITGVLTIRRRGSAWARLRWDHNQSLSYPLLQCLSWSEIPFCSTVRESASSHAPPNLRMRILLQQRAGIPNSATSFLWQNNKITWGPARDFPPAPCRGHSMAHLRIQEGQYTQRIYGLVCSFIHSLLVHHQCMTVYLCDCRSKSRTTERWCRF